METSSVWASDITDATDTEESEEMVNGKQI